MRPARNHGYVVAGAREAHREMSAAGTGSENADAQSRFLLFFDLGGLDRRLART